MALDNSDVTQILDAVGHLATREIPAATGAWEHTMDAPSFHRLLGQITELGLLPQDPHSDAPGLWSALTDPQSVKLSLGILRALAHGNAALALATHRQALAQWVLSTCACPKELAYAGPLAFTAVGHYGLGRHSLARWLADQTLSQEDQCMLGDWLDHTGHVSQIWASPNWQQVVWPIWLDDLVQWRLDARPSLSVQRDIAPHGLAELDIAAVSYLDIDIDTASSDEDRMPHAWTSQLSATASRALLADVLKIDFLATMAIALGSLERGAQLARDFAGVRRQGAQLIEQHPAVQEMLADIYSTQHLVEAELAGFHRPLQDIDLVDVASARWNTSRPLVHASHQVIQIHGGVGYMQDAGPEKLMREQNMLRLTSGGAQALPLFITALNKALS